MKLSPEALLEIMAIFQNAVLDGKDASQQLRELDLVVESTPAIEHLTLSNEYKAAFPRATIWPDQEAEEV
jgi:hypothetical protein